MANPRRRTRALRYFGAGGSLRYFGAGGWPVGLPETSFGGHCGIRGPKSMSQHGRPRGQPPLRLLPSFWRWGLARRASRNKFPSDAKRGNLGRRQPWQTRAVARARSVISALGAGPSGFSKQLSGRRPKLPRQPWQTRAVARARSVVLALGAGPSGFPKQFSGRRPKLLRQSFWRWGLARRASRNKFPSDAKRGGSSTPTAMANPRRRTRALRYFGAGGWPVGLPETIFRAKLPRQPWQPAPSLAHAPVFWRWGLARRASRNKFPSDAKRGDLGGRRGICGPKPMSQHGRPRFSRARASQWADFILPRIRSLSAAKPSHLYPGLAKRFAVLSRPASRSGRFIKGDGRFIKAGQPQ